MLRCRIRGLALGAWSFSSLAALGCGEQAAPTDPPVEVIAELAPFAESETVPPGVRCTYGGQKFSFGNDANGNGALEGRETRRSRVECHPAKGYVSRVARVAPVESCAGGTVVFETGLDRNGDGKLEDAEVTEKRDLCIARTVRRFDTQKDSRICPGLRVETGIDLDGNGTLDIEEVTTAQNVCGDVATETLTLDSPEAVARAANLVGVVGDLEIGVRAGPVTLPKLRYVSGALRSRRFDDESVSLPVLQEVETLAFSDSERLAKLSVPALVRVRGSFSLDELVALRELEVPATMIRVGKVHLRQLSALAPSRLHAGTVDEDVHLEDVPELGLSVESAERIELTGGLGASPLDVGTTKELAVENARFRTSSKLVVQGRSVESLSFHDVSSLDALEVNLPVTSSLSVRSARNLARVDVRDGGAVPNTGESLSFFDCFSLKAVHVESPTLDSVEFEQVPALEEVKIESGRVQHVLFRGAGHLSSPALSVSLREVKFLSLAQDAAKETRFPDLRSASQLEVKGVNTLERISMPGLEELDTMTVEGNPSLRAITMPKTARLRKLSVATSPKLPTCIAEALASQPGVEASTVADTNDAETCAAAP